MPTHRYLYACDRCSMELVVDGRDKELHESDDKSHLVDVACSDFCGGVLRRVWNARPLVHRTPGFYAHDSREDSA